MTGSCANWRTIALNIALGAAAGVRASWNTSSRGMHSELAAAYRAGVDRLFHDGYAASVSIGINTPILEVQCTTEQQARIRACAKPLQQTSVGPYKTIVTVESDARQSGSVAVSHEIRVDPSRRVIIKTLLF